MAREEFGVALWVEKENAIVENLFVQTGIEPIDKRILLEVFLLEVLD